MTDSIRTSSTAPWLHRDWPPLVIAIGAVVLALALGRIQLLAFVALAPLLWAGMRRPELIVSAVIFILYANVAVVAVKFHGAPKLLAMLAPAPLLMVLYQQLVIQRKPVIVTRTLPWIGLFMLLQMLSFVLARDPMNAWPPMQSAILEGLCLYFLVTNVVRSRRLTILSCWALAAAGAFMGAMSLLQWLTGAYGSNFGGFAQVSEGLGVALDESGVRHRPRVCGPIGEQNRYAQVMVVLMPLLFCWSLAEPRRQLRWLLLAALALTTAGCLLTYSRGAIVGLAFVWLLMTAAGILKLKHLVPAVGIAVLLVIASPSLQKRLLTIPTALGVFSSVGVESTQPDGAVKGRFTAMLAAVRVFQDHPLLGVGPGQFNLYSRSYSREGGLRAFESSREAHSLYLELAAENGILGLVAFLCLVGIALITLQTARKSSARARPRDSLRVAGFQFALVGYLATAMFLHFSYARYFWLMLALADAAAWTLSSGEPTAPAGEPRETAAETSPHADPAAGEAKV